MSRRAAALSRRIALMLLPALAALALLAAVEGALRATWGAPFAETPWHEFDYFYSDIYRPFFRLTHDAAGRGVYITARPGAVPQKFAAEKPKGLVRIFVVGGSVAIRFAVQGRDVPLRDYLRKLIPGKDFEVIGCGMAGYDSYRDSLVQKEILGYQPDAIILLSGNNEYFNPETASPAAYKLARRLRAYWVFRWPMDRWTRIRPSRAPTLAQRLAFFEKNLRLMTGRARARGVPMILCTLPANIRDSPPLRSAPRLSDPDYLDARAALESGDALRAQRRLEAYIAKSPDDPFGHYWLGRLLDESGRYAAAREQYLSALDLDDPGERCSPRRNAVIRRVARDDGMIVADLQKGFDELAEHALPDSRVFIDAVHWRAEYYPFVCATILSAIREAALSGGPLLAPASAWDWAWLARLEPRLRRPMVTRENRQRYRDQGILKAFTYIMQARGRLSEGALGLFELELRSDPRRLQELARSPLGLGPSFKAYPWLVSYEPQFEKDWADVTVHLGEAYRRRREPARALRVFDEAIRTKPRPDLALLLKARALSTLRRETEARAALGRVSPAARGDPFFAYWLEKLGSKTP